MQKVPSGKRFIVALMIRFNKQLSKHVVTPLKLYTPK